MKFFEHVGAGLAFFGSIVWFLWPNTGWTPNPEPMLAMLVSFFAWVMVVIRARHLSKSLIGSTTHFSLEQNQLGFSIIVGSHHDDGKNLWERSGLVGTGDAIAAGRLYGYMSNLGAHNCEVVSAHNYPGTGMNKNLVLVGGPDANIVTKQVMERLSSRLKFGDSDRHVISIIDSETDEFFNPEFNQGGAITSDHGVILKAVNPFNPSAFVLILAGSFGQGTLAAALFACSEDLVGKSKFTRFRNYELLVKSDVVDLWPQLPKLVQSFELR